MHKKNVFGIRRIEPISSVAKHLQSCRNIRHWVNGDRGGYRKGYSLLRVANR